MYEAVCELAIALLCSVWLLAARLLPLWSLLMLGIDEASDS